MGVTRSQHDVTIFTWGHRPPCGKLSSWFWSDPTTMLCSDIAADKSDQQPLESRLRKSLKRKTAVRRILIVWVQFYGSLLRTAAINWTATVDLQIRPVIWAVISWEAMTWNPNRKNIFSLSKVKAWFCSASTDEVSPGREKIHRLPWEAISGPCSNAKCLSWTLLSTQWSMLRQQLRAISSPSLHPVDSGARYRTL